MNFWCKVFGHKAMQVNPEKGITSATKCERCDVPLSKEIVWPEPPPLPLVFDKTRVCAACRSSNIKVRLCRGIKDRVMDLYGIKTILCSIGSKPHLHKTCECGYTWTEKPAFEDKT